MSRPVRLLAWHSLWALSVWICATPFAWAQGDTAPRVARAQRAASAPEDVPDEQIDLPQFALARIGGSRFSAPNEPASLAISPDGRRLAVAGVAREVCLFDSQTGRRVRHFDGAEEGNLQTAFSADGRLLAAAGFDGLVRIWNPENGDKRGEFRAHGAPVRYVGFVLADEKLVTAGADGFVRFWNTKSLEMVESFHMDEGAGDRRVAVDDKLSAVYWPVAGRIVRWDPGTVKAPFEIRTKYPAHAVQAIPASKLICVLGRDRNSEASTVQIFDATTTKELISLDSARYRFTSVALSPDGRVLATGNEGGRGEKVASVVRLLDWQQKKLLWELELADCVDPECITFSPDGTRLFVSFGGNVIRIYDVARGKELFSQPHECRDVTSVSFSRTGKQLLIGSGTHLNDRRGRVSLWDFEGRACRPRWQVDCGYIWSAALSPDDRRAVSHGLDGRVTLRDARDGRVLWEGPALGEDELSMSRRVFFRGAADQIVLPEVSGTVRVFDGRQGTELKSTLATPYVHDAALARDGNLLALAKSDATVALWNIDAGRAVASFDEHSAKVFCVAFGPEDRFVVSGGRDTRVLVWDPKTGKSLLKLAGHKGGIVALGVSPDGETIVSSDESAELIIWDARDGHPIHKWRNEGPVSSLAISPDGQRLACANGRGRVLIWDYRQLRAQGK